MSKKFIASPRRHTLAMFGGALASCRSLSAQAQTQTVMHLDFENTAVGQLPSGMTMALTGGGGPVNWTVIEDKTAPAGAKVLAQTSVDRTDNRFPLAILDATTPANLRISVRFKPVAGSVDRAAGIALRLRDANNYYVVRANALEDNVRLYRVVAGRRIQFEGANTKVPSGIWQELAIEARGSRFDAFLNDKNLFTATDTTFTAPGRVALWTKADSVTYFDDLLVRSLT